MPLPAGFFEDVSVNNIRHNFFSSTTTKRVNGAHEKRAAAVTLYSTQNSLCGGMLYHLFDSFLCLNYYKRWVVH